MGCKEMREQFENLPEIANRLIAVNFNTTLDRYEAKSPVLSDCNDAALYLNGAWYSFQEQQKRINELNQWNGNQYQLIKRNEDHTQSLMKLLKKLIDDDCTTMRPSMSYEIKDALRGEHE